jgi:hypothetical protein
MEDHVHWSPRLGFHRSIILRIGITVVFAVLALAGLGAKLTLFPAPAAESGLRGVKVGSMNVLQMHIELPGVRNLPVLDVKEPI